MAEAEQQQAEPEQPQKAVPKQKEVIGKSVCNNYLSK